MAVNSFTSNQGTQTPILTDNNGGTSAGTIIPIMKISTDPQGTFTNGGIWNGSITGIGTIPGIGVITSITTLPNLQQGSIQVTAGTIASVGTLGTLGLGTLVGKDANAVAQTGNPIGIGGTDSGGTIRTIKVDSGGLQRIGIDSGTISVLPTLPQGSIQITAGTIASVGTIGTLGLGTITGNLGTIGTLGLGTITGNLGTMGTLGTLQNQGSLSNVGQIYNAGTIQGGSIVVTAGTVRQDGRTTQNILTYGTQVAFTGAGAGTIVGSASVGAGTSLWLQDASLFNLQSGAGTFILGFGTAQQGTNVLLRAPIGTSGAIGIEKPYAKAVNAGMTNQDLVLSATGAGTVDLSISYFISS